MIPLFDARREFSTMADQLEEAALRVLRSGRFILGPEVEFFEEEAAAYLGTPYAVACGSGTEALWLALKALDIGPGDAVLTSGFSFFATASAILNVGAVPIFCDITPETCNLDPVAVRAVLQGRSTVHDRFQVPPHRVKAIMPVHLYGRTADMDPLVGLAGDYGIPIVEDAAQAFGSGLNGKKAGTFGSIGCFSFFPTKNLGGFGDGGMVATNDARLADRLRLLRQHGSRRRYEHELIGANSRLDELQAALLRVRLARIDELIEKRRSIARHYDELLQLTIGVKAPQPHPEHSYNYYAVRVVERRDELRDSLSKKGIGSVVYYPVPLHLQRAVGHLGYAPGDLPEAERACNETLALPMFPSLSSAEVVSVVEAVRAWEEVASQEVSER